MRYFVSMIACQVLPDGNVRVAHYASEWRGGIESEVREACQEKARERWPVAEGWQGHDVFLLDDPAHVNCIPDPFAFARGLFAGQAAIAAAGKAMIDGVARRACALEALQPRDIPITGEAPGEEIKTVM